MTIEIRYPNDKPVTAPLWVASGFAAVADTSLTCTAVARTGNGDVPIPATLVLSIPRKRAVSRGSYTTRRVWLFMLDLRDLPPVNCDGELAVEGNSSGRFTRDLRIELAEPEKKASTWRLTSTTISLTIEENGDVQADGFVAWGTVSETGQAEEEGTIVSATMNEISADFIFVDSEANFWAAQFPPLEVNSYYRLEVMDNHNHVAARNNLHAV